MELLFEIPLDLISEGVAETSQSKKVPKPIRYTAIALVVLFFVAVLGLILFMGIALLDENPLFGGALLILGVFLSVMSIAKFRKVYLLRQREGADADFLTETNERTEE